MTVLLDANVLIALAALDGITRADRHEFWPAGTAFADVRMMGIVGHRQVTDAYLAQLARDSRSGAATQRRRRTGVRAVSRCHKNG